MPNDTELAASYEHCRNLAWAAARNFYYGFALLPAAKRDALCALYAFMRRADDISDSDGEVNEKGKGLKAWRNALDQALPVVQAMLDRLNGGAGQVGVGRSQKNITGVG